MNETELVQQAQQGHPEAYRQLVERYRGAVYGLAYHQVQDFEDAQDIAQEAFIKAYLHLSQLRDPGKFGPWLRRITVNECKRWQRQQRQRPEVSLESLRGQPDEPTADLEVDRLALRLTVQQALQCLSETTRLTLTLYYMHHYSQREIAEFLEVPVTTVKGRLRDARARLKKELQEMVENTFQEESLPDDFSDRVLARIVASLSDAQSLPYVLLADEQGRQLPLRLGAAIDFHGAKSDPVITERSQYPLLSPVLTAWDIRLTEVRLRGGPDQWQAGLVCQQGEREQEVEVPLAEVLALALMRDLPVVMAEPTLQQAAWSRKDLARLEQPLSGPLQMLPSGAGLLSRPEPEPAVFVPRELIDAAGLVAGDQVAVRVENLQLQPWERYLVAKRVVSARTAEGTAVVAQTYAFTETPATTVQGPLTEHEEGYLLTGEGDDAGPVYLPALPFLNPGDRVVLQVREPREPEQCRLPLGLVEVNEVPLSALPALTGFRDTVPQVRRVPRRTALVVTDVVGIRELLRVNLQYAGWEVVAAEDGIVGLERARETRPEVILWGMPRPYGYETIWQLQADDTTALIPLLMFVVPRHGVDYQGPIPDVAGYVTLPFDPMEMLALVEMVTAPLGPS